MAVISSAFWAAILIAGLVAAREAGWLERAELLAYDIFLRGRPPAGDPANVAVVEITDTALEKWGWPVPDGVLAAIVKSTLGAGAAAAAVDVYRDRPVPPGSDALADVFSDDRVFGAMKFAGPGEAAVSPPAVLAERGRFGFVDFPVDEDGVLRRALLYLDDGTTVFPSLALSATLHVLAQRGVRPVADPADPAAMRLGSATIVPLEPGAGPYADADTAGYQILIDFRMPSAEIPAVDAEDLLRDPAAGSVLAGRIVFIGMASELVKDLIVTPVEGTSASGLVNGVMLHAWAADQLTRYADGSGQPLSTPSEWLENALIVGAAALGLAAGLAVASPVGIAGAGLALFALLVGGAFALFLADFWVPVVPSVLAAGATLAIAAGGRAAGERRQRQVLMRLFAQQVSTEVADDLWERREELLERGLPRPLRLAATILFLDLRGSTQIADRLSAEVYIDWVGRFLERMAETAIDHGGLIDKYTGDGLMIVFGAPVPRQDPRSIAADACSAIDCARAMTVALSAFNANEGSAGRPAARIRIGIHSGQVYAGCVGSSRRRQYTVTGAAVNAAARLESLKIPDQTDGAESDWRVLVSESTAELAAGRTDLLPAGRAMLRGFAEPVGIYRLDPDL